MLTMLSVFDAAGVQVIAGAAVIGGLVLHVFALPISAATRVQA